jgi:hypothetical protein
VFSVSKIASINVYWCSMGEIVAVAKVGKTLSKL